jgi:hypothetical protein
VLTGEISGVLMAISSIVHVFTEWTANSGKKSEISLSAGLFAIACVESDEVKPNFHTLLLGRLLGCGMGQGGFVFRG